MDRPPPDGFGDLTGERICVLLPSYSTGRCSAIIGGESSEAKGLLALWSYGGLITAS